MVKNLPASAGDIGDLGSVPGLGRCPAEGPGNSLKYSCLENPVDRGACRGTSKHLLYSTGNSTQCSVITYMRIESGKDEYMCIYICCTPETNIALETNYNEIKIL